MNFKGKKGPGFLVMEKRHRSSGGKNGGIRRIQRAKAFDAVKAPPLNWVRK